MRIAPFLALLALLAAPAFAQSPTNQQIPYQGVLSDAGGPLADGSKTIQFALSDTGGGSWSETATVTTTDGVFAHRIGSVETITGIDFSRTVSVTTTYVPAVGSPVAFGPTPLGASPTSRFAQEAGSVEFPLSGTATTLAAALTVENLGSGDGLSVTDAGDDGIQITNAGGDGIFVVDTGADGVDVANAGGYGVLVKEAALDGVRVANPTQDGLHVAAAGDDGLQIAAATDNGIDIGTVGTDGAFVDVAGRMGFYVRTAVNRGFEIDNAGDVGVLVFRSGDTDADNTPDADRDGVNVGWAGGDGLQVTRANGYGVRVDGELGNYLRSESTATLAADITLGGLGNSAAGDNGVIATDPAYSSSDMFGVSNDAIVFYIDNNADTDNGEFEIRNGSNALLWSVLENGTVSSKGPSLYGAAAVRIDDPTAPSSRTLTLPSVVSDNRMVAFSGNVTTDGSGNATVSLPSYAESVAGDFRYQLTVIGSFAQAIVGEEVSRGRFAVRTSEPGVKVSWRVEGVRQDAWAAANAHTDVTSKERSGTYIHPEAYGVGVAQSAFVSEDTSSQITPEGQARLDAEATEAAEIEASVEAKRVESEERAQEAAASRNREASQRDRDTER